MLPFHPLHLHRLTAPARAAVLAISLLAGVALAIPAPAEAQIPPQAPDLTVALTPSPTIVEPQEKLFFDVTVRFRNGRIDLAPKYAYNVVLEVQVPAGSTIRGIRPDGQTPMSCSQTSATVVRCQIPQLSDQQPVTATVKVLAPTTMGTHTASAQVDPQNTVQEFVESNNTATAALRVRQLFSLADASLGGHPALRDLEVRDAVDDARPALRLPDLAIWSTTHHQQRISGGETAAIRFEVQNLGTRDAQGVIVRADAGNLLAIASANLSGNACSAAGTVWTCTLDLPAGGARVPLGLTVTPAVAFPEGGSQGVGITATIDPANASFETNEGNNAATVPLVVA